MRARYYELKQVIAVMEQAQAAFNNRFVACEKLEAQLKEAKAVSDRLRDLAQTQAFYLHTEGLGSLAYMHNERSFDTCMHPDCVLVWAPHGEK